MNKSVWKRVSSFGALCVVSSVLLAGCMGEDKPSPSPSGEPSPTIVTLATATVGVGLQATPTAAVGDMVPAVSLSVNGARDAEVLQGWPLIVEVGVTHPNFMRDDVIADPIVLGGASKSWTEGVKVNVVDADGKSQAWPLKLVEPKDKEVTLDATSFGSAYWTLGVEETAKLKDGAYIVTAILDGDELQKVGTGEIESIPAVVTVKKAPATLTDEQQAELAQNNASQAFVEGDSAGALDIIDGLLEKSPRDIAAMEFKGDILAGDGKYKEAMEAYGTALKVFYEDNPESPEPPSTLAEKQHDMMDKLLATP